MEHLNYILSGILIIVTFLSLAVSFYAWRRRDIPGVIPLFLMSLAAAFYTFGYSMELITASIQEVNWWGKFQYTGLAFIPSLWVIQAHAMTSRDLKIKKPYLALLITMPLLTCIFRWTNEYHGLIYKTMSMVSNGYFEVLTFQKGIWYNLHYVFFFFCAAFSVFLYFRASRQAADYLRRQFTLLAWTSILPFAALLLNQVGLSPLQLDSGPITVFIIFVLFSYAVDRYDMMHIIPLSRDVIFDWIYDGALVVDQDYRLRDFNQAARKIFPSLDKKRIGSELQTVTEACPVFVRLLETWDAVHNTMDPTERGGTRAEDTFEFSLPETDGKVHYFKARPMALFDEGIRIGSTVLITNVTNEKEMFLQLERTAQYDGLTGVFNRSHLLERIQLETVRLERQSGHGVLILFDIDHFKHINDRFGHQAGDVVLRDIAAVAKGTMRTHDLLGRYGGEEFIAFLPDISLPQAMVIVERLRAAFEAHRFVYHGQDIPVTASFGVTEFFATDQRSGGSIDDLVRRADQGLYQAKKNGRNQLAVV